MSETNKDDDLKTQNEVIADFKVWKKEIEAGLDKDKSNRALNMKWMLGIAASIALLFGANGLFAIPALVKKEMDRQVVKSVEDELKLQKKTSDDLKEKVTAAEDLLNKLRGREQKEVFPYSFYALEATQAQSTVEQVNDGKGGYYDFWRLVVVTGSDQPVLISIGNTTNTNPVFAPAATPGTYKVGDNLEKGVLVDLLFHGRTDPNSSIAPFTLLQKDGIPGTPRIVRYVK